MTLSPAKNPWVTGIHVVGAWALGSVAGEAAVNHVNSQIDDAAENIIMVSEAIAEKRKAKQSENIKEETTEN